MNSETLSALRAFRRLFFRTRDAYDEIASSGGIRLHVEYHEGSLTSGVEGVHEAAATTFVVLMRRFMHRADPIYCERIWEVCQAVAGELLTPDVVSDVNGFLATVKSGGISLKYNERSITAEALYEAFSSGGFFDDDASARQFIDGLTSVPAAGALPRFVFIDYSINVFRLVSTLFEVLRRANAFESGDVERLVEPCIFCLRIDGGFTGEEHVLPESLGNDAIVLSPGLVCDRCNRGALSVVDQALVQFEPVAFLRTLFMPHTKGGKLPSADFRNVAIEKIAPRRLRFRAKNRSGEIREVRQLDDGRVELQMTATGKRPFDPRPLGRALYKVGLELVALEEGADVTRSSRFDRVRRFVLDDDGVPDHLLVRTVGVPEPRMTVTRNPRVAGTIFLFSIYGLALVVNLEAAPALATRPEFESAGFVAFSLAPRVGA